MATRGLIGVELPDGVIKSVYCHHDSYYTSLGFDLYTWYNTPERIKKLITLGALSSVDMHIGERVEFKRLMEDDYREMVDKRHQCVAYCRDAGRSMEIDTYDSYKAFMDSIAGPIEFVYLFRNGEWYAKDRSKSERLSLLRNKLKIAFEEEKGALKYKTKLLKSSEITESEKMRLNEVLKELNLI